ncbi:amidohydrolase [Spirulina sp. 06S082]|uniref:amidohydrolase n=1 Tax=Spirulina sp. 06S082 TaxID=3110248 RepID=UPI002B1ED9F6|nr:amidohydrolase [Spirulina sp. 06S082]MEA5472085.1 amidohydrolase [Spirulina sp. 06S082]
MESIQKRIKSFIQNKEQLWIQHRRSFHTFPEMGWLEYETTVKIIEFLQENGIDVEFGRGIHTPNLRMGLPPQEEMKKHFAEVVTKFPDKEEILDKIKEGFTGVVATIQGEKTGTIRAIRCDIDALPILEMQEERHFPASQGFSSRNYGVMHACGHDVHAAIGLGIAQTLQSFQKELSGTVKIIFQPAEEGVRGAVSMVESGIVDNVQELYTYHVGVKAKKLGEIIGGWNKLLHTTKINLKYIGRRAHAAAAPEEGIDALDCACETKLKCKELNEKYRSQARVNIGKIVGGEARNIIAPNATLDMEIRAVDNQAHDQLKRELEELIDSIAQKYNASFHTDIVGASPLGNSDPELANKIIEAAKLIPLFQKRIEIGESFGASDDAATWMNKVQSNGGKATYFGIGTPICGGHHTEDFDIDEQIIPATVELLAMILLNDRFC